MKEYVWRFEDGDKNIQISLYRFRENDYEIVSMLGESSRGEGIILTMNRSDVEGIFFLEMKNRLREAYGIF